MDILIGTLGYSISALGFVCLFLLLLTTRQKSLQRTILLLSSLLCALWGVSSALQVWYDLSLTRHLITETLRNAGWFLLVFSALSEKKGFLEIITANSVVKTIALLFVVVLVLEIAYPAISWLSYSDLYSFHLAQSVMGLWLIEQLYRRTTRNARWTIKPICLGLGLTYAYDFALYADGVLTKSVDTGFWYGRGWVTVLSFPLILLTARRVKHWSTRVYISRDVVYHSTLLMVAGAYLLIMAIAGYYIRYAGGNWGSMAQNIFFALSGLTLASLFLSEPLRRKLRVFIAKHFYANKYEYRQEWMRFASILEEEVDSPYQIALNAMIRPFDCERGMIVTRQGNRLKNQAEYNLLHTTEVNLNGFEALVAHAIEHKWIIDIDELKQGEVKTPFNYSADLLKGLDTFTYIVPITSRNGIESACLLSTPKSTHALNWEDRDLMWAISKQLSVFLNLYHTNQTLAENQQFDTFNRMSAFLAHDLKNILAQLQLLSKNAKKHKDNPEFIDDAFDTIDSAVLRLSKVVTHLRKKSVAETPEQTFPINLVIQKVVDNLGQKAPAPLLESEPRDLKEYTLSTDKERFTNVISHVIQNAQEATTKDGMVKVTTSSQKGYFTISVEDDGIGMTEDFIENRLFKPFDTTKGNSGMGVGAYDAKRLIEQLNGYIDVHSAPGKGSVFVIHIPVHSQ